MHDNEIVIIQKLENEHNVLTGKEEVIPDHREYEKNERKHIQEMAIGNLGGIVRNQARNVAWYSCSRSWWHIRLTGSLLKIC